jgi:hypothetical protein
MITRQRIIFIGGVPATGKTYFSRWLLREHGFTHVELEEKCARDGLGLTHPWDVLRNHGDPHPLMAAVRRLGSAVVLDWGFPPAWMFCIQGFADGGAELWWFEGDRARAREEFAARASMPLHYFDRQLAKINRWWPEIAATFAHRQLHVLGAGGERLQPELIWAKINQEQELRRYRPLVGTRQIPYPPKSMSG